MSWLGYLLQEDGDTAVVGRAKGATALVGVGGRLSGFSKSPKSLPSTSFRSSLSASSGHARRLIATGLRLSTSMTLAGVVLAERVARKTRSCQEVMTCWYSTAGRDNARSCQSVRQRVAMVSGATSSALWSRQKGLRWWPGRPRCPPGRGCVAYRVQSRHRGHARNGPRL